MLNSDHSDEELLSAASESWYNDNINKTAYTFHLLPVHPADWQLLQMTCKAFVSIYYLAYNLHL